MAVVAYLRVSTEKQFLENQREEITRFAEKNGMSIDKWYTETVSGSISSKERKLSGLLDKMRPGDSLIVTEISRLSRTLLEIMTILNSCIKKEVILYSTKEGFKTRKPQQITQIHTEIEYPAVIGCFLNPPAMFCVICVIIHSDRKQPAYLLWCKKRNIVVLDTPICRASSEHDVPFLRFFISSFLFSASILILGVYPFFRPKRFPSCFLRASASLVRIEIRLRSISAINPNANPSTLLLISF